MFKILVDEVYLFLLEHPYKAMDVNYSKLEQEIGIGRKAISTRFKKLKTLGYIDEEGRVLNVFDIKEFYPQVTDKYERALRILRDIMQEDFPDNLAAATRLLGVSDHTLKDAFNVVTAEKKEIQNDKQSVVYCVRLKKTQEIIYIGYSANFEHRKNQHRYGISTGNEDALYLYGYCKKNNIHLSDVEITPVFEDKDLKLLRRLESSLIELLKPQGNLI